MNVVYAMEKHGEWLRSPGVWEGMIAAVVEWSEHPENIEFTRKTEAAYDACFDNDERPRGIG